MAAPRLVMGAAVLAFVLATAWQTGVEAQQTGRASQPLVIPSMTGDDLFRFYCAACHGRDGKGDGPVAAALNRPPADLTTIARRNGGSFPRERVERFVTGDREPAAAHGSAEMPVWGPIFQYLENYNEAAVRQRIKNLCDYIESIQQK